MVELLLWGCKELKKNFVFIPIIFVLALVLSFIFSEKDPSKTEKAIQPVNKKFELTEREKNKILLDIRKTCSKLINLVSSKDTTTDDYDSILPNYFDESFLATFKEQILEKVKNENNIVDRQFLTLPLDLEEYPSYTVISNDKVKVVWSKVPFPSNPNQLATIEITLIKQDDQWKIIDWYSILEK